METYLKNPRVVSSNVDNKTFESSLRVFVDHEQTPVCNPDPSSSSGMLSHGELYKRFNDLQCLYRVHRDSCAQEQPRYAESLFEHCTSFDPWHRQLSHDSSFSFI